MRTMLRDYGLLAAAGAVLGAAASGAWEVLGAPAGVAVITVAAGYILLLAADRGRGWRRLLLAVVALTTLQVLGRVLSASGR